MIGLVVTGHGNFASGITSDVQLVAGEQEGLCAVDFPDKMTPAVLRKNLEMAVKKVDQGEGVVIFADLAGGTPFNQSVLMATDTENIKVLAGINMPLLMDSLFNRQNSTDEFVLNAIESGKNGIVQYKQRVVENITSNEGI